MTNVTSDQTGTQAPQRFVVAATPADVLKLLPSAGSVMLTVRNGGAAHERIGAVDEATAEGDIIAVRGANHAAAISPTAIGRVIVDRSGKMRDLVLPRIDFEDAEGEVLFSIIGMAGLEPFDAGFGDLPLGEALDDKVRPTPERGEVADNDPGMAPFAAAVASGAEVTIEMVRPGLVQAWQGIVEQAKPGMGFINVMRPDFHLHLKAGSVARWRTEAADGETVLAAENEAGEAFGLRIRTRSDALAGIGA